VAASLKKVKPDVSACPVNPSKGSIWLGVAPDVDFTPAISLAYH